MDLRLWHFSPATGELVGESVARVDPLEGKKMIPANSVEVAPPEVGADQAAVWSGGAWVLVDDYRGFLGYEVDGTERYIFVLGEKPSPSWLAVKPAKSKAKRLAEKETDLAKSAGAVLLLLLNKGVIARADLPAAVKSELAAYDAISSE